MSAGDAGWLATDMGDAYGEEAVEAVEKPSAGSSDKVRMEKVEPSSADTFIRVFRKPPKLNFEDRHSSTRLARSGELLEDMYEELRLRKGSITMSGVLGAGPPNNDGPRDGWGVAVRVEIAVLFSLS